jgi:hypothetical protein
MAEENDFSDLLFQLEKIQTTEDRHFLFRAFARSIDGNELCCKQYRDKAVEYITKYDLLKQLNNEEQKQYLVKLKDEEWGGQTEITSLALGLKRHVKVFLEEKKDNGQLAFSLHQYPDSQGDEADDLVEEGSVIIYLLCHPIKNTGLGRVVGHYDLLVKKAKVEPALVELTKKLKEQEEALNNARHNFSKQLQTRFLRREIMDMQHLISEEVVPVLDNIAVIARKNNWYRDKETLELIYDMYCDLMNSVEVSGVPEKNIFRMNPFVIFVHIVALFVYYPVMIILMVLLMLGRAQAWFTLITRFAGASISAISTKSDGVATASQILGIITGILAAAKGINLEGDYLYERVADLMIEILQRSFGNISKDAVFQPFWDCKRFEKFKMTIEMKRGDIRMVQAVRIFLPFVTSTSLVQNEANFSYIYRMHTLLKLVEGVLMDPFNYLTFSELTTVDLKSKYGFRLQEGGCKRDGGNRKEDCYSHIFLCVYARAQ